MDIEKKTNQTDKHCGCNYNYSCAAQAKEDSHTNRKEEPMITTTNHKRRKEAMKNYKVTGVLRSGARFKAIHTTNPYYAMGINLFRGNVWEKSNGKWKIIKSVWN